MNLNANFSYNGFMQLLHENSSSCLAFCVYKVMSIKLLEKRKASAESEAFNLDNPKLQIFLICSVYNNNKLHPRLMLDMNNMILLGGADKNFYDARTFCNSLTYQFQCIGKSTNKKSCFRLSKNLDSLAHAALPINCSATILPHNL